MTILIIDDSAVQRVALSKMLRAEGYDRLLNASCALEALEHLHQHGSEINLILSDLHMPEIDGIEACRQIKAVELWHDIPIIMITQSDDMGDLQAAFEAGAMDYITKPPGRVELLARVRSALKLKHEMDSRKAREAELRLEKERSERLLLNVLPQPIAERLKCDQHHIIADRFDAATVLFADLVGFTPYAANRDPETVVEMLNEVFSAFDTLAEQHGLEKIKTLGDSYMAVAGVPMPRPDHAHAAIAMARDMLRVLHEMTGGALELRIGLHTGPLVAGVIGIKKFSYDLWGDTVNLASRMESHGCAGMIHISEDTYYLLRDSYPFHQREPMFIKGRGEMVTYLLGE